MSSLRSKFDEQLDKLNDSLIEMGQIVEQAINGATKAFMEKDVARAAKIVDEDDLIDDMEKEIERLCLKIILRQSPVAGDLKFVSAVLKIITDLERIGDHAADISEITLLLARHEYIKELHHIPQMAELTMAMLNNSIDAFVKKDIEIAKAVIADDDKVDDLYMAIKGELIELIKKDVQNTDQAMDFITIAKYFERVGDHATNIAEWVVFSLTGVHKKTRIM
jgi:phosphate transport system protein